MTALEFMHDCYDCNFSYGLYKTMAKMEGFEIFPELAYYAD